jgi:hypothetical protein
MPLRLPYLLNPYPLYLFEYLPRFCGEDHIIVERHLEAFEFFFDQFEIVHDDVTMILFSKKLFKDAAIWFKELRADSIGSWTELSKAFSKHWGDKKSFDLYLAEFYALRRDEEEPLSIFNKRFYNTYHNMSLEIRPTEIIAMVYYVMAQHSKLVLILLERKSSSLSCLFEDAQEIEENICSSKRIQDPVYFEDMHAQEQRSYQYVSVFEQEDSEYEADLEQQQECEYMSDWESNTLVFADVPMDMYAWQVDDQFSNHFDHEVTDDCIGNFMFLVDHNPYDVNPILSLSYEHHSEEMIVTTDDQDLITRELQGH